MGEIKVRKIFLFLFLFLLDTIYCANYPKDGTDRLVNVFTTLKTLNAGDYVSSVGATQGLCWFRGGIRIAGTSGLVNFASPMPVDREIFLDPDVSLNLQKDLILSGSVRIASSGYISCGTGSFVGSKIILTGPLSLETSTITCSFGALDIEGNGNIIDFSKGAKLDITATASLYLRNCILEGMDVNSLFASDKGTYFFDNVVMKTTAGSLGYISAIRPCKSINLLGDLYITGTTTFIMGCDFNFFNNAKLYLGSETRFRPYGSSFTIKHFGNKTGGFHFNGSIIELYSLGTEIDFAVQDGNLIFENDVTIFDNSLNKRFVAGPNCSIEMLGNAHVVLEDTVTFSIL